MTSEFFCVKVELNEMGPNREQGRKVALDDADILYLKNLLEKKFPNLVDSLPGFVGKVKTSPNEISQNPAESLKDFTENEKAILYIWLLNPTYPDTHPEQIEKQSHLSNGKKRSNKELLTDGIQLVERHVLIGIIFKKIEEVSRNIDWSDAIDWLKEIF